MGPVLCMVMWFANRVPSTWYLPSTAQQATKTDACLQSFCRGHGSQSSNAPVPDGLLQDAGEGSLPALPPVRPCASHFDLLVGQNKHPVLKLSTLKQNTCSIHPNWRLQLTLRCTSVRSSLWYAHLKPRKCTSGAGE